MKLKYKVYMKIRDAAGTERVGHSKGSFASYKNARKALDKYSKIHKTAGEYITAFRIIDIETGETVESFGGR